MKIHNVRLGHACNSSSTHSLIFLRPKQIEIAKDEDISDCGFNWEPFVAASSGTKLRYFACAVAHALHEQGLNQETAKIVVESLFEQHFDPECSIDHQSMPTVPAAWPKPWTSNLGVDLAFVADLKKLAYNPAFAILGGNDNDHDGGGSIYDKLHHAQARLLDGHGWTEEESSHLRARKDGSTWVIYNHQTGAKVRLSFEAEAPDYVKASLPELVDVKITDQCTSGCTFCYQGSTPEGKHADDQTLDQLAEQLARMKVFEVAIGGGEPTRHPGLEKFVSILHVCGVTPNMTTRNLDFLRDPPAWALAKFGAVAYSLAPGDLVEGLGLEAVGKRWQRGEYEPSRLHIQVIDGLASQGQMNEVLDAGLPLTILGFKRDGRGLNIATPHSGAFLKLKRLYTARVDTAILATYEKELEERNVSPTLCSPREGAFSCYIDAVKGTMAPSSYGAGLARATPLPEDPKWIQGSIVDHFQEKFSATFATY